MHKIIKVTALSFVSAALLFSTGCAHRKNTSEVVVAPMGVPGNSAYAGHGGDLVNNSQALQDAAQNINNIVYFAFDSSEISSESAATLDQQASFLASNPSAKVLVAGHTDERGSREYNHALGERRAQAVKSYLAAKGIADARVETISYGEERLATPGVDEASHAQNRRAELSY